MKHQTQLLISFRGINLLSMEDCAPSAFQGSWGSIGYVFVFRFCIFYRLVLEEYVSEVEGVSHLLQSCLCVT
jgi:hypothetical protein